MLRKLWKHLIALPEGLDTFDKLYVYGHYLMGAMLALCGFVCFIGAFFPSTEPIGRLVLIGSSFILVLLGYGHRLLVFWLMSVRVRITRRLGLK